MVREIPLTKGYVALVDDEDFERVNAFKWFASEQFRSDGSVRVYGQRSQYRGKSVMLHRFILNAPVGMEVDHEDGDGLNCQRVNLRLATKAQNAMNRRRPSNNTTGFKGVSRFHQKYAVKVRRDRALIHIGTYDSPEFAAAVYDAAARHLFGPFALTNFDIPNPDAEAIIAARFAESEAA